MQQLLRNITSLPGKVGHRVGQYRWITQPAVIQYMVRQYVRSPRGQSPHHRRATALEEAVAWLYRSMDRGEADGSRCYNVNRGWSTCYPEVTGYNLYTLYDHFHLVGCQESFDRATRMAEWLLTIQFENGAYQGSYIGTEVNPVVFNTGQILQGLCRAFKETQDERFLDAGRRAADWLVDVQDDDGVWRAFCYLNVHHVTDTRIAYPLAEAWEVTGDERYRDSAARCLHHVAKAQNANGWFPNCDNSIMLTATPNTHTLAYTTEGLLKGGLILDDQALISAARRAADAMLRRFEIKKTLHGRYDENWRASVDWVCLTGCAQMAENWLHFYGQEQDSTYLNAAIKMIDYLCAVQDIETNELGLRGGLAGSEPMSGNYLKFSMPSWATKYFCDALMAERKVFAEVPN